jgi:hypothetical protein
MAHVQISLFILSLLQYRAMIFTFLFSSSFSFFETLFRRLRKIATSDSYIHARLFVHMEQLGSHWKDFYEI